MNVLIIGAGRIGSKVIQTLEMDRTEITVVDSNYDALVSINSNKMIKTIVGNGMDDEIIDSLNIPSYDYVLALTDSDKTNILVSRRLKDLGAKFTIARVNSTESIYELFELKESLGIDYVINPKLETAKVIRNMIENEVNYISDTFGNGKIEAVGHLVEAGSEYENKKLSEIGSLSTLLVAAIDRKNKLIIPSGDTVIEEGDYLYLIGLRKDIIKFKSVNFKFEIKSNNKDIIILGANGTTIELAKALSKYNVKLIVQDSNPLRNIQNILPDTLVVRQKMKGAKFFENEEIENCDYLLVLTEDDELNISLSLMAKKYGAGTVISKIESLSYSRIFDELNFVTLNPLMITANAIIKTIRRGNGISIHLMFGGKAEVSEIKIGENLEIIGKTMQEINLPKGILIGGIVRENGIVVIPRGKTKIEKNDTLVIFCTNENRRQLVKFINPKEERGFLSEIFLYQ